MVGNKENKPQKSKGVNTCSYSGRKNTHFSDTDTCSTSICGKSISKVRNEVQTVIELMGPNTPHFNQSSSNMADNEDSIVTNTSIINLEKSSKDEISLTEGTDATIPPDVTIQEDTDLSLMVGKNSTSVDIQVNDNPQYICPPPFLPANVVFNSECMCPQIASYLHNGGQKDVKTNVTQKNIIHKFLKGLKTKRSNGVTKKCEYYKMNIKQSRTYQGIPKRLVFNLVDDLPKTENCQCNIPNDTVQQCYDGVYENAKSKESKNLKNELLCKQKISEEENVLPVSGNNIISASENNRKLHAKTIHTDTSGTTRVDVYYFDHGSFSYLHTTDSPPVVATEALAEKTETYTTKFWAEIFGTIHIGFSFCTSFVLQLVRFVLYSLLRPLTVGLVQLISDYFFKPCLATIFNALIQPPLTFLYNVATSLRDLSEPLAEGIGFFLRELAFVIRAFRIVDIQTGKCTGTNCNCSKKFNGRNRLV